MLVTPNNATLDRSPVGSEGARIASNALPGAGGGLLSARSNSYSLRPLRFAGSAVSKSSDGVQSATTPRAAATQNADILSLKSPRRAIATQNADSLALKSPKVGQSGQARASQVESGTWTWAADKTCTCTSGSVASAPNTRPSNSAVPERGGSVAQRRRLRPPPIAAP